MSKRSRLVVLGLGAVSTAIYHWRRHWLASWLKLPPPTYQVQLRRNIRVPVAGELTLATDHYQPVADEPLPTILIRTPYGRGGLLGAKTAFEARRFAERGYHVICQDTRGRFDSDGSFVPYVYEAGDGQATLAWIAAQPWFNGRVGMWGQSYVGYVQWAAATATGPDVWPLHALVLGVTASDLAGPKGHGFQMDMTLRWMLLLDAMYENRAGLPLWRQFGRLLNERVMARDLHQGFQHLPLKDMDAAVLGRPLPYFQTWADHSEPDDPYWQALNYRAAISRVMAPAHLIGGWYDILLNGQLADFAALQAAGRQPYLTIGPWCHSDPECEIETVRAGLAWFQAHLNEEPDQLRAKPVRLYLMGADRWLEFDHWPPPARRVRYYLQPGGELRPDAPPVSSEPDRYRYDPADPTPSLGGPLMSPQAGPRDNRPLEARSDVMIYTTPPLEHDLDLIGPVRLNLFAGSSRQHTDFFGRLCDVRPDGRSMNICDGLFRLKPGRGQPQPDGTIHLEIDLSATAQRFKRGHRLRLQISSGVHPRIARNLGTGEPEGEGTRMVVADQMICHDAAHPSALVLPVWSG